MTTNTEADRPANLSDIIGLEQRTIKALEAAQFNMNSLQNQIKGLDSATEETFGLVQTEFNRVLGLINEDINSLRDDNRILHEVTNDIDNEKGELEDRVGKLERRLDELQNTINQTRP